MSWHLSLKYRIAATILLLEAILLGLVLQRTLSTSLEESRAQLMATEQVVLQLLGAVSRVALLTEEYDDLQLYIEDAQRDPHIERVLLADARQHIIASSTPTTVGKMLPALTTSAERYWRTHVIANAAEHLGVLAIEFSAAPLLRAQSRARNLGVGIAVTGMTIIALVGVGMGFILTRRLDKLTQAAQRLAKGEAHMETGLQGQDEIAQVGRVFDTMAQQISADRTRLEEARQFLQSTLDALTAHIAILDEAGTILAVNAAWRRFTEENAFLGASHGVGTNYLHICDVAADEGAAEAPVIAQGIREVMTRQRESFVLEYSCHSSIEQRWFLARVTCFDSPEGLRVVVAHDNITERKQAEEALQESERRLARTQQQLLDAIESLTEGFALYDAEDRLVLCNEKYREIYDVSADLLVPGTRFEDHIKTSAYRGQIAEAIGREEEWVRKRVAQHRNPPGAIEQQLGNGRWLLINERPTSEGGIVGVRTDITTHKHAEEALRQMNVELERRVQERTAELAAANEEVRRFAYIVSHDLRAPLVNLKGFARELRDACDVLTITLPKVLSHLDEGERVEIARIIQEDGPEALAFIDSSVTRMDHLIQAILNLSRVGRRELHIEPVNTEVLVQDITQSLTHQLAERQVQVTVGSLPEIHADRTAMEQIFSNLLGNAVQYLDCSRPGEIMITAEQDADVTTFHVQDNGRGIAKEDIPRVFELFRRVGPQDTDGEGMGLTYVQALVRRHGGEIWCQSTLGGGTTFTFTISHHLAEEDTCAV